MRKWKTYPSRLHSQNFELSFSEQGKLSNCPNCPDARRIFFRPDFKFAYIQFRFSTHTCSVLGVTGLTLPYLIISHWPTDFECTDLPPLSRRTGPNSKFTTLHAFHVLSKNLEIYFEKWGWLSRRHFLSSRWGGVRWGWGVGGGGVERCDF